MCPSKSRVRHGPEDSVGETEAEDQALGLNEEDAWSYTSPFSGTAEMAKKPLDQTHCDQRLRSR